MGKKSKRQRSVKQVGSRREAILSRRQAMPDVAFDPRADADRLREKLIRLSEDPSKKLDPDRILAFAEYISFCVHHTGESRGSANRFLVEADNKLQVAEVYQQQPS